MGRSKGLPAARGGLWSCGQEPLLTVRGLPRPALHGDWHVRPCGGLLASGGL